MFIAVRAPLRPCPGGQVGCPHFCVGVCVCVCVCGGQVSIRCRALSHGVSSGTAGMMSLLPEQCHQLHSATHPHPCMLLLRRLARWRLWCWLFVACSTWRRRRCCLERVIQCGSSFAIAVTQPEALPVYRCLQTKSYNRLLQRSSDRTKWNGEQGSIHLPIMPRTAHRKMMPPWTTRALPATW